MSFVSLFSSLVLNAQSRAVDLLSRVKDEIWFRYLALYILCVVQSASCPLASHPKSNLLKRPLLKGNFAVRLQASLSVCCGWIIRFSVYLIIMYTSWAPDLQAAHSSSSCCLWICHRYSFLGCVCAPIVLTGLLVPALNLIINVIITTTRSSTTLLLFNSSLSLDSWFSYRSCD